MDHDILEFYRCPACRGKLVLEGHFECTRCEITFPSLGNVPCLVVDPASNLERFRAERAHFVALAKQSCAAIEVALGEFALLPATRRRLQRLLAATRENTQRVVALLDSAGLSGAPSVAPSPVQDFSLVEYYDHILRDWSKERHDSRENVGSLQLIQEVVDRTQELGRTLVIGAGACRLAYDLERQCAADLVIALDLNPLLLITGERIASGQELSLYEFPAVPASLDAVCVERQLSLPHGPAERLFFVLADAFHPPFEQGVFDTVVTPWFIDIVTPDLRDTLSAIHRLLRPGGRWVNYGPLSYAANRAASQRYTVEEVLELCSLAGFQLSETRVTEIPLLESTANARSRFERVLAFAARKTSDPATEGQPAVPSWLLFSHVPIPRFEGLSTQEPEHPVLAYLASQIDGQRTLFDIANDMIEKKGAVPDAALQGTRALISLLYQTVGRNRS